MVPSATAEAQHLKRRTFVGSAGAGAAQLLAAGQGGAKAPSSSSVTSNVKLAGMTLPALRKLYNDELFQNYLPFWEKHGIDHERGGFMCGMDYDGKVVSSDKLLWFQGRGIWLYSFLYNNFGKDAARLEVARKTRDFVLKYGPQPDGWWAEVLSRDGKVVKPFQGDIYGMYFIAEGLQEYAWAAKDDHAHQMALDLMKKLYRHIETPSFHFPGEGEPGMRPQGLWMVNLNIATQMLKRWKDPEIAALADKCVDAIIHKHYNPDIGLNNELLNHDFSRAKGEETKSLLGHSTETLWMVMDEALRRNDQKLWQTCAERARRHIDVGWDRVFGGLSQWVNVDQGSYVWPVDNPIGTDFKFKFVGEYEYMKALWALNEVLIATLNVFERTGAPWAAEYFGMAQEVIEQKFWKKKYGLPGYMLFGDRRMTHQPHVARQDNYHPPRQLMLSILTLDRMIGRKSG
jgi:N-acylglucosamine 2-epimerase